MGAMTDITQEALHHHHTRAEIHRHRSRAILDIVRTNPAQARVVGEHLRLRHRVADEEEILILGTQFVNRCCN